MNKFNWIKAISYGAIIWAIMFVLASALAGFGVVVGIGWSIAMAVISGIVAYLFSVNVKSEDIAQALGYGAVFVVIGIALDLIISQRFVSGLFTMWTYYLGYALVLFAPSVEFGSRASAGATLVR